MNINYQFFSKDQLTDDQMFTYRIDPLLPGEIDGVITDLISVKGPAEIQEPSRNDIIDVILTLDGAANISMSTGEYKSRTNSVVRIPYESGYVLRVEGKHDFCCLRIRKSLEERDREVIEKEQVKYISHYAQPLSECKTYKEDIKSRKTTNRMILPEAKVPRLVIGSVETKGPDAVEAHEHPMLDQLFLGLDDCMCTIHADGVQAVLREYTLLHIPLGSRHHAEVATGDLLSYIWMDFFLTLAGESYISDQHIMEDD